MKVFLAALVIIGIGVFAMCFNIIFRGKEFPDSDVGTNENMKKMGIRCFKEEEMERLASEKKKCPGTYSDACAGCGLYKLDK